MGWWHSESPAGRHPALGWPGAARNFNAGPPIIADGAVWILDQDSGTLLAYDPANGRKRGRIHVGSAAHIAAPSAPGGLVLIATGGQVTAVTMG